METSRPLLRKNFVLQKFHIDHNEIINDFDEFDPEIPDEVLALAIKFEVDRRVTLELWTKKQYNFFVGKPSKNYPSKNDPAIRLANFFEVCAFAIEFDRAHVTHGNYHGFDSIIGKSIFNKYFPIIYKADGDDGLLGIYSVDAKRVSLPKKCLVVTKETLL